MVFKLFSDVPKTARNFKCLCTGERDGDNGKALHYKGNKFHRIVPEFMIQAGDITHQDGTGGESIYGVRFPDENYNHAHDAPYKLAMANCGQEDSNSS